MDDFFEGDAEGTEYQDDYLVKAYCNRIEVPYEEYIKLFAQTNLELLAELLQYDIFQDYKQAFNQSTEIKNLRKSNLFKNKTGDGAIRRIRATPYRVPAQNRKRQTLLLYFGTRASGQSAHCQYTEQKGIRTIFRL